MTQRPIKFRAWDKERKLWYEENDFELDKKIGWFFDPFRGSFFQVMKIGEPPRECTEIELIRFTGLHDKNGKEIWEGDILATEERDVLFHVVHGWNEDGDAYGWNYRSLKRPDRVYSADDPQRLAVIGNVFENPELLKQ